MWTSPRTWVTAEIVTAAQLNAHVRDNLKALSVDRVATTMAAAVSAVTATDGLTVSVRINSANATSLQETVEMTYNASLGKWYSAVQWLPLQGSTAFSGTGVSSGTITFLGNHSSAVGPKLIPWREYNTAGLVPSLRVTAVVGFEFTGSQTLAQFSGCWYSADLATSGADAPLANAQGSGAVVTVVTAAASGTTGSILDTGWGGSLPVTADYLTPSLYVYGTGTGTYNYFVKHATAGFRWQY